MLVQAPSGFGICGGATRSSAGSRVRAGELPEPAADVEAPDRDQDAEDDGLRARRTAGNVDIDRKDPVDAAGAGIPFSDDPPGGGAGSHGGSSGTSSSSAACPGASQRFVLDMLQTVLQQASR